MKTILVLLFAIFLTVSSVQAQTTGSSYKTALGFKFPPTGITVKHFITDKHALEGIAYFLTYGARITGLYEIHGNINQAPGLQWYIGPGAHLGFYNNKNGNGTALGIDGVLGLDYKIDSAPINLSIDWQPFLEFGNFKNSGFIGNVGGIAIRYTLN
jgi:hypothetical protein